MLETKQQHLDRIASDHQKHGDTDGPDLEWLLDELSKARAVLRSCLRHHGDGPLGVSIRNRLGIDANGQEQELVK